MKLIELSKEYRSSGEKCKKRVNEISEKLGTGNLTDLERIVMKRRITMLSAMARDAIEISNRLANYYEGAK